MDWSEEGRRRFHRAPLIAVLIYKGTPSLPPSLGHCVNQARTAISSCAVVGAASTAGRLACAKEKFIDS